MPREIIVPLKFAKKHQNEASQASETPLGRYSEGIYGVIFILCKTVKAMLHGAIFLATCNAILLLRDVN
jgi:hypothetical protein